MKKKSDTSKRMISVQKLTKTNKGLATSIVDHTYLRPVWIRETRRGSLSFRRLIVTDDLFGRGVGLFSQQRMFAKTWLQMCSSRQWAKSKSCRNRRRSGVKKSAKISLTTRFIVSNPSSWGLDQDFESPEENTKQWVTASARDWGVTMSDSECQEFPMDTRRTHSWFCFCHIYVKSNW